jgi:hypothetical protein
VVMVVRDSNDYLRLSRLQTLIVYVILDRLDVFCGRKVFKRSFT